MTYECPRKLTRPIIGVWPLRHAPDQSVLRFPEQVSVFALGRWRLFRRARLAWTSSEYREDVRSNSLHMKVSAGGGYVIDHADCSNPDRGVEAAVEHVARDMGGQSLFGALVAAVLVGAGVGLVGAAAAVALTDD